jgi:hypothetical protein
MSVFLTVLAMLAPKEKLLKAFGGSDRHSQYKDIKTEIMKVLKRDIFRQLYQKQT